VTHRVFRVLAWSTLAVSVALTLGGVTLAASDLSAALERGSIVFTIPSLAFCVVGALVASRFSRNPVGWLILAFGVTGALSLTLEEYARIGLVSQPGSLPWPELATGALAVFADWVPPGLLALAFLFFPDGRLPSQRWRKVVWLVVIVCGVNSLAGAFSPGRVLEIRGTTNPLGNADLAEAFAPVLALSGVLLLVVFLLCAGSLIIRFRRSRGDERQQIKWFAFAAVMITAFLFLANAIEALAGTDPVGDRVGLIVFPILLSAVPVAIGVAIFRYRLYDIDRIISRTLAYGALTAVLGGGYLLAVLGLQSVLPLQEDSPLIVAVSTLAVVAAFGPLRTRIQHFVDRRFNRSRYDAEHTIAEFAGRLRSEVELDTLALDLVAVVENTVQPAHVSVWLRTEPGGRL